MQNTGYKFPILNSDGSASTTIVDMATMFVPKSLFLNSSIWVWGSNIVGQLGNGTTTNYSSPIQIGSLTNWKQVSASAGGFLTIGIKTDGTLWTCGYNYYGQLGNNTTTNYSSPIQVGSLTNWSQIAGGAYHTAAIKTDGTLWTWGYNGYGNLGNNTATSYSSPIQVGALTNWKQVSCGYNNTVAIKTDGTLWAWRIQESLSECFCLLEKAAWEKLKLL